MENQESKTPLTDAEAEKIDIFSDDEYCSASPQKDGKFVEVVDADFARQMEMEIKRIRSAVKQWISDQWGAYHARDWEEKPTIDEDALNALGEIIEENAEVRDGGGVA